MFTDESLGAMDGADIFGVKPDAKLKSGTEDIG